MVKEIYDLKNYKPIGIEPYSYQAKVPWVIIVADQFKIEDFEGTSTNWADLSKFYHLLNLNRDVLPESTITEVASLIKNETTTEQKVKKIYEYVQSKTRYQSIQLGIGGWQTYDATYVASNGYGDCKALSNYMYSLLKEAGIKFLINYQLLLVLIYNLIDICYKLIHHR